MYLCSADELTKSCACPVVLPCWLSCHVSSVLFSLCVSVSEQMIECESACVCSGGVQARHADDTYTSAVQHHQPL